MLTSITAVIITFVSAIASDQEESVLSSVVRSESNLYYKCVMYVVTVELRTPGGNMAQGQ